MTELEMLKNQFGELFHECCEKLGEIRQKLDDMDVIFKMIYSLEDDIFSVPLINFDMSVRLFNILRKDGKETLKDVLDYDDKIFSANRIAGKKSLIELKILLIKLGVAHFSKFNFSDILK